MTSAPTKREVRAEGEQLAAPAADPGAQAAARLASSATRLAALLDRPRPELLCERPGRGDLLVICGVLGAKDVGKSSLVNALAGQRVSLDESEVGEGTSGLIAYVHADETEALRRRLSGVKQRGGEAPLDRLVTHRAERLRQLVLVDLPDFSSTFVGHADLVRRVAPSLDRIIWLWDPIVLGDRSYTENVGRLVKDSANVYRVLNKADLLLRDEVPAGTTPEAAWAQWRRWFEQTTALAERFATGSGGAGATRAAEGEGGRRYLVSAAHADAESFERAVARSWGDPGLERHAEARPLVRLSAARASAELSRLRDELLSPVSGDEARGIHWRNRRAEIESDRRALAAHFDLARCAALAAQAEDDVRDEVESATGGAFRAVLARRLQRRGRSETDLAEEVFAERVERWPILPTLYYGLRGVVRWGGRRLAGAQPVERDAPDLLAEHGRPFEDRVDAMLSRVRVRTDDLLRVLRSEPEWPSARALAQRVRQSMERGDDELDERVRLLCLERRRAPGRLARAGVWGVLLWFPLLQPLTLGVLQILAGLTGGRTGTVASGTGGFIGGLAKLVEALSGVHLLSGLLVALVVYLWLLAVMFARSVRDVRQARSAATDIDPSWSPGFGAGPYAMLVESVLQRELLEPMLAPVRQIRRELDEASAEVLGRGETAGR